MVAPEPLPKVRPESPTIPATPASPPKIATPPKAPVGPVTPAPADAPKTFAPPPGSPPTKTTSPSTVPTPEPAKPAPTEVTEHKPVEKHTADTFAAEAKLGPAPTAEKTAAVHPVEKPADPVVVVTKETPPAPAGPKLRRTTSTMTVRSSSETPVEKSAKTDAKTDAKTLKTKSSSHFGSTEYVREHLQINIFKDTALRLRWRDRARLAFLKFGGISFLKFTTGRAAAKTTEHIVKGV